MTTTVHLAVFDTLADWEVGYVTAGVSSPDYQAEPGRYRIRTVGPTTDPVTTMGGLRVVPDLALADLRPEDSAMLVLPGGDTWADEAMGGFRSAARRFVEAGVPVAAVCGATLGLALEGLLDDREHTSNAAEFLAGSGYGGGERYVEAPAVTDGDVITASGIAPVDFARAVFARLGLYDAGVLDAWYRLYAEQDPSGFYALAGS